MLTESPTCPDESSDVQHEASRPETDAAYERYMSLVGYNADGEYLAKTKAVEYVRAVRKAK